MKPTLAMVLAVLALGACRNYTHFERTASVHDDASVQVDGGLLGDGGKTGCVLAGLGNLDANPAVRINTETQHLFANSPTSVALVQLPDGTSTALGLYPGISYATLLQVDNINGTKTTSSHTYNLELPALAFAVTTAPDHSVHIVVALSGSPENLLVEYTLQYPGQLVQRMKAVMYGLPSSIAFGDLDADGNPDLIVGLIPPAGSSAKPHIWVYPGTAMPPSTNFNFLDGIPTEVPLSQVIPTALLSIRGGASSSAVFLAVLQQADQSMTSDLELLAFKTPGSFGYDVITLPTLPTQTTTMTAADIDNDGQDDLVLGGEATSGMNSLFAITKLGGTMVPRTIAVDGSVFGLQRIDWNQDGADDLFVWLQTSTMPPSLVPTILQNRGGRAFEAASPTKMVFTYPSVSSGTRIQSPVAQPCPPRLVFSDTVNTSISVYSPVMQP